MEDEGEGGAQVTPGVAGHSHFPVPNSPKRPQHSHFGTLQKKCFPNP